MADNTKIQWADATWNIITGCSLVSPGCTNCYAMRLAGGRLKNHPSRAGLTRSGPNGPVWNGHLRFNEQWLHQPLTWRRPRRIFVCAHGDLFHEDVQTGWLNRIFSIIALCPQHQFLILTKRADRMRGYAKDFLYELRVWREWPMQNVWLGVSVEDQIRAAERIPLLLTTPAAVRWISAEPLLGPVSLEPQRVPYDLGQLPDYDLDWVVVGGESGPQARDMDVAWARSLREECRDLNIAFFMKQMARRAPIPPDLRIREWPDTGVDCPI